jgi:uncharacterized membrane protein
MAEVVFDSKLESERSTARWLYLFHGASLLLSLGALSWIPLIVNYVKRPDAAGTFVQSHHTWQIRSFWWYLFWMFAGWVLFVTVYGIPFAFLTWGAAWIWKAYRLIKGLIDLGDGKPMPV